MELELGAAAIIIELAFEVDPCGVGDTSSPPKYKLIILLL